MSTTTLVGLDVGSSSIRAVEASITKDRPTVTNFGQAHLAEGTVIGGVVKDDKAVTQALRALWSTAEFSTKSVVLGISHQQVIVREIEVTNLPPKELHQALPFLVRDALPLPVDQALIDFYPLEKPDPKQETVRGLVIAAPKAPVIETVHAVENAGLHVAKVDLACFAALRASAHLASDTEALIDLGASATNIIVHTDGTPKIVRTVPRGAALITKLISTRMDITAAEAEAVKCRRGLVDDGGDDDAERVEVIEEALRPLIAEIRSSFNYYASTNPDHEVKRLALVGGGALLPGLTDELTAQLGVPTFLSDPMQRVLAGRKGSRQSGQVDALSRFRSSAAVSIGLTLGAA